MKDCTPEIRNTTILDLVNRCVTSVRLKNCIASAAEARELPFNTINGFLEAGEHAKEKLLGIRNLGERTANELINIIDTFIKTGLPKPERYIDSKDCPPEIRNAKILDIVNRCLTSVRLKNCIASAAKAGELPFNTVDDFLEAGEYAKEELLDIRNMGEGTANELIDIINIVIETGLPEPEKHIKSDDLINFLNSEYPGVFRPLIDEYVSTSETELLKLIELEKILRVLCERPKHAKMVWRRFSGETLESIGKSFGVTRERVRQIIKRYSKYTTDINSPDWAEKSIRDLISKTNTENRLPDNQVIKEHHPKLATSLVKNFSSEKSGKLTSELRLEIAKTLNLNIDYELIHWEGRWILEKLIFDIRKFAEKLGKPDLMPLQKELTEHGRQDLRGAVWRFGGQSKVADLAGLIYQGQIVSPDGSRRYWTDKRIGQFLHEVANKEGHPGVMPTKNAVKKHTGKSTNTVVAIFTRSTSINKKTISWHDLAKQHKLQYKRGK